MTNSAHLKMDDPLDCGHLYDFGDVAAKRTKLMEIVDQRLKDVAEAKALVPEEEIRAKAAAFLEEHGPPQQLTEALDAAEATPWGLALVAEFKRASPWKDDIRVGMDAAEQALRFTKVGARVLSVLTEPTWFKGTLSDLKDVRIKTQRFAQEHGTRRPECLRKDFHIDEYQVFEALAYGADTLLLMVSILSRSRLKALIECCRANGIEPLVEVVTEKELEVAVSAGARIFGVNNRDLHTFGLKKERTNQIAQRLRDTHKICLGHGQPYKLLALSGLSTSEDVDRCRGIFCSGVLVGEALMRAADPCAAVLEMMGPTDQRVLPVAPGATLVKVCGVVGVDDARCAVTAGANLIGVIFAQSKRQVNIEQAKIIVDVVRKFGERTAPVSAQGSTVGNIFGIDPFTRRCKALRQACKWTPLVVGVFMDQPLDEVVELATASGVDAVQLHGSEDLDFVISLRSRLPGMRVLKAVHISEAAEAAGAKAGGELRRRLSAYSEQCDALLLDTSVNGGASGGTGATFGLELACKVQDAWGVPVIFAGGLTDTNVGDLVSKARPYGIDVASGVEDPPGVKDDKRIQACVRHARRAGFEEGSRCSTVVDV